MTSVTARLLTGLAALAIAASLASCGKNNEEGDLQRMMSWLGHGAISIAAIYSDHR